MEERYLKISTGEGLGVTFGTFHSFFYAILRELPQFRDLAVADRKDQLLALKRGMIRKFGKSVYTNDLLSLVLDDIGRCKNGMGPKLSETKDLYSVYNEEMKKSGLLDYDDMLLMAYREMEKNRRLLNDLRDRYTYFLIDEFQDINRVQYMAVRLMAFPRNNLFCVGDDDQSIYGFRGSDPAIMRIMPKELPDTRIIELTVNYRSTENIVFVTGKLIRNNRNHYPKHAEAFCKEGERPVMAKFRTPAEEAAYIAEKVKGSSDERSFAVLGRTNRAVNDIRDMIPETLRERISFHTFHTSKGLEFDTVFVAACNEEVTPGQRYEGEAELEEERRTFYVAATRAKKKLYFLFTEYYKDKESPPSRFLKELL